MSDPFEDATSNGTTTTTATAPSAGTAVPAAALQNTDDPFGTVSQYRGSGGQWDPRVPFEDLEGRLIVMKPISFRDDAPKREEFRQNAQDTVQDEWRVEMWILSGAPFSFKHKVPNPNDPAGDKVEAVMNVDPSQGTVLDTPIGEVKVPGARFRMQSIPQGQLIQALNGVSKQGKLLIGVMSRVPIEADRRKGVTPEQVKSERAEWFAAGGRGKLRQSTWALDDRAHVYTPALASMAGAWWAEYRKTV